MADQRNPGSGNGQRNEGEGNYTAARQFDEAQQRFAKSGQVEQKAKDALEAIDGPEGEDLRKAEKVGKAHAKEEDRLLNKKPS